MRNKYLWLRYTKEENKETDHITCTGETTGYRWVKRFMDAGETSNPEHKTRPGEEERLLSKP